MSIQLFPSPDGETTKNRAKMIKIRDQAEYICRNLCDEVSQEATEPQYFDTSVFIKFRYKMNYGHTLTIYRTTTSDNIHYVVGDIVFRVFDASKTEVFRTPDATFKFDFEGDWAKHLEIAYERAKKVNKLRALKNRTNDSKVLSTLNIKIKKLLMEDRPLREDVFDLHEPDNTERTPKSPHHFPHPI